MRSSSLLAATLAIVGLVAADQRLAPRASGVYHHNPAAPAPSMHWAGHGGPNSGNAHHHHAHYGKGSSSSNGAPAAPATPGKAKASKPVPSGSLQRGAKKDKKTHRHKKAGGAKLKPATGGTTPATPTKPAVHRQSTKPVPSGALHHGGKKHGGHKKGTKGTHVHHPRLSAHYGSTVAAPEYTEEQVEQARAFFESPEWTGIWAGIVDGTLDPTTVDWDALFAFPSATAPEGDADEGFDAANLYDVQCWDYTTGRNYCASSWYYPNTHDSPYY